MPEGSSGHEEVEPQPNADDLEFPDAIAPTEVEYLDLDGDGLPDAVQTTETVGYDVTRDGRLDVVETVQELATGIGASGVPSETELTDTVENSFTHGGVADSVETVSVAGKKRRRLSKRGSRERRQRSQWDNPLGGGDRPGRIVVGLIDTPSARMALRWAYRMAQNQKAELDVVTAYALPPVIDHDEDGTDNLPAMMAGIRDSASQVQDRVLREELGTIGDAVVVHQHVLRGDPEPVLVEHSADAQLLVVGRRRRRFRRFGGSISRSCANNSQCPVVIVRTEMRVKPIRPRPARRRQPRLRID